MKSTLSRPQYKRVKEFLFRFNGPRCAFCGMVARFPDQLTVDHVVPLSLGGSDDPGNLVLACIACNNVKGAAIIIPLSALVEFRGEQLRRLKRRYQGPARKAWLL